VQVSRLLSDTWTMLILHSLMTGDKRFCEIESDLQNISTRTLTNKLKQLREKELIEKTDTGFYRVTKKGLGIRIIEQAMIKYSQQYLS